jgi:hypothetical protein
VIVVDGRMRRRCLIAAREYAADDAVFLLHDAERTRYHCAFEYYPAWAFIGAQLWIGAGSKAEILATIPPGTRIRFGRPERRASKLIPRRLRRGASPGPADT